ncbi:MAG: hypothetical protein RIQ89_1568 [Bacteroidota bacterium]
MAAFKLKFVSKFMKQKIKIGIFFGGHSREREVSFAGGRTVYDNLNKTVFEPVPIFVDSFGHFCLLRWEYIYKGSIRDFYPTPAMPHGEYAESKALQSVSQQQELLQSLGTIVAPHELHQHIDFAFLCLHGTHGEDGRIQGLLAYHGIPYSGSGILSSAIGMNKIIQKQLMKSHGFESVPYTTISRQEWLEPGNQQYAFEHINHEVGFPCVVKAANQGSSIGISILADATIQNFTDAIDKALFIHRIDIQKFKILDHNAQLQYLKRICDIREGIGLPVVAGPSNGVLYSMAQLHAHLLAASGIVTLSAIDAESQVLVESFIEGKEFSCIVIATEQGIPIALPPTEIRKGKELFDYRSKYLPGLSRKITPIDLPDPQLQSIRTACEKLFSNLHFDVYARIDGFITPSGAVLLNDPNTTSGMMPSSFFFHQAAEIGLNPSQFLTFIIRSSVAARMVEFKNYHTLPVLLAQLDAAIHLLQTNQSNKTKVAVLLGGYSSERHISVESGRNIFEKLSSSEKYAPVPVFVSGTQSGHALHTIPIHLLLKDNADDIKEKILHYAVHPIIATIRDQCQSITQKYAGTAAIAAPAAISYEQLAEQVQQAFIALHGRPGEDGQVQNQLELVGISYNGSRQSSSAITIDKYKTNELLKANGFLVADHAVYTHQDWAANKTAFYQQVISKFSYPFIIKPVDDGCSSAVKKIKNIDQLQAYCELVFRTGDVLDPQHVATLQLKAKEEFPAKTRILVESLITGNGANHFLEITGGMLTRYDSQGQIVYEVFESSEALSEGDVLSLEEKFLAGQGQNITPARYHTNPQTRQHISNYVRDQLMKAAQVLQVEGYCRIDAFVRIYNEQHIEVVFIEVNSLPGMTPATCIFHQTAINGYKPLDFIDLILTYGQQRSLHLPAANPLPTSSIKP